MEAATLAAPAHEPQHLRALANANRVRLARAQLKRLVAAGEVDASCVLRECPWEVQTMSVGELLQSQRRWGRARVQKFLVPLFLNENRPIGRLTLRQRGELAEALDVKHIRR